MGVSPQTQRGGGRNEEIQAGLCPKSSPAPVPVQVMRVFFDLAEPPTSREPC